MECVIHDIISGKRQFLTHITWPSLIESICLSDEMSDEKVDKAAFRWSKIQAYLKTHEHISNADVRELCGVSAATANRILAGLTADHQLEKYRVGGHWAYKTLI